MISSLSIKNLSFFIQMQQFIANEQLSRLKVTCDPSAYDDVKNICENIKAFSNVNVLVSENIQENLINETNFIKYALKRPFKFEKCQLTINSFETIPELKGKKYIYFEDFKGDQYLEQLSDFAKSQDMVLYSNHSLKRTIPNVFVDRKKYTFIEKLGIFQNCSTYIGLDKSNLAPTAFKFKKRFPICIINTNSMIKEEVLLRFYPADDLDFMYNNIKEYILNQENAQKKEAYK